MTIGIPRAFFYFKNPYFWEFFFDALGLKTIISPPTNKEIVEKGVKASDPETCFSIKVFFGHLAWLDKKVDYIFIPRLKTNKEKLEYCPKFFGLPDIAKISVKTQILTEVFDYRKRTMEKSLKKLGERLINDPQRIKRAIRVAFQKEKENQEKRKKYFFETFLGAKEEKKKKIVLISHQYNLYDSYVNFRAKERLEKLGAEVVFINEVPLLETWHQEGDSRAAPSILSSAVHHLSSNIQFHWEFGKEIMERIQEILKYDMSGAVEISSFQCGCDAVLKEFVEKEFKQRKIPFLYLIIDEQTGEAGFQTRLEAFMDTLNR